MTRILKTVALAAPLALVAASAAAPQENAVSQKPTATQQASAAQDGGEGFGVPVFPGAEPRPEVARAVEAFNAPGVGKGQRVATAVFETPAPFQEVYDFYAPRMEPGRVGWRKKTHGLDHQAASLKLMRERLLAGQEEGRPLPEVFEPLFGDPELSQEEFEQKLQKLQEQNTDAEVEFAEGVRRIAGDPEQSLVRVVVSHPYLDLERMELVDRTRILLIKITPGG